VFCWLLFGDFAWSMRDRSIAPMSQWYLNEIGVPNYLFGLLVTSFPALIGMILGPIISVKSDRHRGPRGRRIPFLLVTTPIAAAGMVGLGGTPVILKWMHGMGFWDGRDEMVMGVICFGVFWTAFEFATIAGGAVFGGLINDVVPKELLGRFYGLFRAISLIDGMIFNYWLMGKIPAHYTLMLVIIGTFYSVAFMWICFRVKEGEYPPPRIRQHANSVTGGATAEITVYFRECFSKPYYVSVFLLLMAAGLSFAPVNTFMMPYARNLGVDMGIYGKYIALTYLISLCLSCFLGWLADVFHPLRMAIFTLAGYAVVAAWGGIYATTPNTYLVAWVMHGVLSGCYFTSAASLGQRLFPHERFAQFASAAGIVSAPANMALAPVVGAIIDGTGNDYRYTFIIGGILAVLALGVAWYVHGQFMHLGGPKNYIAPE
jgi:MFS family permease